MDLEGEETLLGELNTKAANRKVWLVKVPVFLAQAWGNVKESGVELGRVRITKTEKEGPPEVKIVLTGESETVASGNEAFPKEFTLQFCHPDPDSCLQIFSENEEGELAVEGSVDQKWDVKPQNTPEYRSLCRKRFETSTVKDRQAIMLSDKNIRWKHSSFDANRPKRPRSPERAPEKRERLERKELEDLIFNLFERQDNYSLKDLITRTNQPVAWLREVLTELCVYNKRGFNKSTYELKPEYRSNKS